MKLRTRIFQQQRKPSARQQRLGKTRGRRKWMNPNGDFHTVEATACTTDEIIALRLVEKNEVFSTCPVAYIAVECAVVVTGFVYLDHIVLILHIPKCYISIHTKH
ncbi:hypothetical protein Hanom_Chr02g00100921 [Helianthus anomalus]